MNRSGFGIVRGVLASLLLATVASSQTVSAADEALTEETTTTRVRTYDTRSDASGPFVGEDLAEGRWSAGGGLGMLGSTPDGSAFAVNGNAEYFVADNVSFGPLAQLAFSEDMTLFGLTGQGKYYIPMPGSVDRGRWALQGGLGFAHADIASDDTSWLIPLGIGYDYRLNSGMSVTMSGLVNFTNLNAGAGNDADVMPGFSFGVRF